MDVYSYLDKPDLDGRIQVIAGYLARHCRDKHIVDLNCGHAPILHYLPKKYGTYRGNDLDHECFKHNHWRITFYHITDKEFAMALHDIDAPVDILLCLGMVDSRKSLEELESETLPESVVQIARYHKPEIIVLETPSYYEDAYSVMKDTYLELGDKYETVMDWTISPSTGRNIKNTRRVVALERV
jgi:hypothetical protein